MTNFEIYALWKARHSVQPTPAPVGSGSLRLIDWEGTVLKEYTAEQVASLTALPEPSSLSTEVDRDLLTFQGWNWSLTDIKSWVTAHDGECLDVGAIYTTTDGEDHTYWDDPVFGTDTRFAVKQKNGTTTIGSRAYSNCLSLENINLPRGISILGELAFNRCISLKSIVLPDSMISLENYSFVACSHIESVSTPRNLARIKEGAFQDCASLKNIMLHDRVTTINAFAMRRCSSLKSITLPDSITSIGIYAFADCVTLEAAKLTSGVTNIVEGLFQGCKSLKSIKVPTSVTSIGYSAFQDCGSLRNIDLPNSVTTISAKAFQNCAGLNGIVIRGITDLSNVNAFSGIYSGCLFYVPRDNLEWFETATNWSTYYAQDEIVAIEDNIDFLRAIGIDV